MDRLKELTTNDVLLVFMQYHAGRATFQDAEDAIEAYAKQAVEAALAAAPTPAPVVPVLCGCGDYTTHPSGRCPKCRLGECVLGEP